MSPGALGLVIAGWDPQHAALRNHQEKTTKNPPVVLKISASAEKQTTTHSKKANNKSQGSGRAGLFLVGVCSARMTNSHTQHIHKPRLPALSQEGRRQEAVGWDCTVEH